MKKNVIAILLAVVMASGSIGTVPVMAAETTALESDQVQEKAENEEVSILEGEDAPTSEEKEVPASEEEISAVGEETDESASEKDPEPEESERKTDELKPNYDEEESENQDMKGDDKSDIDSREDDLEDDIEAADAIKEKEVNIERSTAIKAGAPKTIEVIGGQYYYYTYATTYGNLSFNANSDYCTVVNGGTISNAGYYYYKLSFYPKDGGKNTIIEVYDNDTGNNIDLLIIHSNYQETKAQTICTGKSIEVTFEAIEEISQNNILVGSIGSDTSISYIFNSFTLEGTALHGTGIPYTYYYNANITLNTPGTYTVNLMDNSTYTTLVRIPVTVAEHEYDSGVITSDATCQKKAVLTKTCSICGDTINEEVGEYSAHDWNDIYTIDKEASCTEKGSESIHCSVCGKMNEDTVRVIPEKGHSYSGWRITREATCTEEGIKEKVCVDCGDKVTEAIVATGHVWEEDYTVDKEATCMEEGSESIHCSVCDEIQEGSSRAIPKTQDHEYGEWAVTKDATCTEEGSREKTCEICGDKITESIPAIGHQWEEDYTVDKEATCTEEGSESIHCAVCDEIQEGSSRAVEKTAHTLSKNEAKEAACTENGNTAYWTCSECGKVFSDEEGTVETTLEATVIPAKGHVWEEDYTVDKDASCAEEGSESIHCSVCGEIKEGSSHVIEKTQDHKYGEWTVTEEATCTEEGSKEKVCEVCGDKVTESIPANGHQWEEDYTVDKVATCTEEGSESIHCAVCNTINEDTVRAIDKKEHAYGEWTVKKEATCTEDGSGERVCADCGESVIEAIPATGHTWNSDYTVDKEATCTEEGSESIHCSACDEIDETTVRAIEKKEHAFGEWTVTKEAACTEDGIREKVCADCGDEVTEVIPATGHTWNSDYTVDKEATCTEEGSESIHCSACDEIDETTVRAIEKREHAYGDWAIIKEATCTEEGSREKVCADCGDTITETIPATGHTWNEDYTVDKEATCAEEGSESIHCSVCGEIQEGSSRVIGKTQDHKYGEWTVTKDATCTEEGSKEKVCEACGDKVTESIPANGHQWEEDYTVDRDATCTEEGSESIHCSVCDEIQEGSSRAIEKTAHTLSKTEAKEAACTEDGNIEYWTCSECGKLYSDDKGTTEITEEDTVIMSPGHNWSDWTVTKPATETETGLREKTCSVCGEKVEEVLPVLSGTWKKNSRGWWYQWSNGSYPRDRFLEIKGKTYCFDESGYMVTGWKKADGKWYYFDGSGAMVYGWQSIGGKWYCFDEDGEMIENDWAGNYYLGAGGAMVTGWQKIDGSWYYFNSSGAKQTGWQSIGGKWYLLDEDGVMIENEWAGNYYLGAGGVMVTGWQKIDGSWYYFNSSGAKQTDWQKIGSTWYFLDESGVMQTGLTEVRGRVFYFSAGGAMQTGWQKIDGVWYYFEGNGVMAVNKWVGNYYLGEDGVMATNIWIGKYYVGADGKWIPDYKAAN